MMAFADVPQIPADAERWEERCGKGDYARSYVMYEAVIDGRAHRWRLAADGSTLLAFYLYRPEPAERSFVQFPDPIESMYVSPLFRW